MTGASRLLSVSRPPACAAYKRGPRSPPGGWRGSGMVILNTDGQIPNAAEVSFAVALPEVEILESQRLPGCSTDGFASLRMLLAASALPSPAISCPKGHPRNNDTFTHPGSSERGRVCGDIGMSQRPRSVRGTQGDARCRQIEMSWHPVAFSLTVTRRNGGQQDRGHGKMPVAVNHASSPQGWAGT